MLAWLCLGQGADLHMAQQMPLSLTISCSSKSRLVLPFWFYLFGIGSPRQSQTKSKRALKGLCMCVNPVTSTGCTSSASANLELVDKFCYLGDTLHADGDADEDVEARIQIG